MPRTERINVYLTEQIREYVRQESERLGVSQSGFIVMAINQYKQQQESIVTMDSMLKQLQQLDEKNRK